MAQPVSRTFQGLKGPYTADYYKIQITDFAQQLHIDLPGPARFIGFQDITGGRRPDKKYLGGFVIARRDRPVQITVVNRMPALHPLPVDTTIPGADDGLPNRASVHFHGGEVPWVSDGGPFAWFSADGRTGPSFVQNQVIPGASGNVNEAEYYYPMKQSARLGWYHDHAYGLTRVNAYAGMASGLLIVDDLEENLIQAGILPTLPGYLRYGIPLVIQDKTFWDPAVDPSYPVPGASAGALWYPWQYESSRWDVGPFDSGKDPRNLPVSAVPEFFSDTILVNGCPYPYLPIEPRHYRFRILNGSQARVYNLQLYYENPARPGEADLTAPGPRIIQIGTEGGFLRFPAVLNNPPAQIGFDTDPASPTFGNATRYNLLLAGGERADIIIDFSKCRVGRNLILFNDAPAPFPSGDPTNTYFTGGPIGDTNDVTWLRKGPNTQTLMQFRVGPFNTLGQGTKADPRTLDLLEALAIGQSSGPCPFPPLERFALAALRRLGIKERWLTLNEDFDEYGRLLQRLGTIDSSHPAQGGGRWARHSVRGPAFGNRSRRGR